MSIMMTSIQITSLPMQSVYSIHPINPISKLLPSYSRNSIQVLSQSLIQRTFPLVIMMSISMNLATFNKASNQQAKHSTLLQTLLLNLQASWALLNKPKTTNLSSLNQSSMISCYQDKILLLEEVLSSNPNRMILVQPKE